MAKLTLEAAKKRYVGKKLNNIEILDVIRNEPNPYRAGLSYFIVKARCVCGTIYETPLQRLQSAKHPSCGCHTNRTDGPKLAGRKRMNAEELTAQHAGEVHNGVTILKFLVDRGGGAKGSESRWTVLARCHCGREYEAQYKALCYNPNPSCGCKRAKRGPKPTVIGKKPTVISKKPTVINNPKPKAPKVQKVKPAQKAEKKAKKEVAVVVDEKLPKYCDITGNVTAVRLSKIWETLPPFECCPAWQGTPVKFVAWGLKSGYTKDKCLVRLDANKPFHPANVRWRKVRS